MSEPSAMQNQYGEINITSSSEVLANQRYEQWLGPSLEGMKAAPPEASQLADFSGRIVSLTSPGGQFYHATLDSFKAYTSKQYLNNGYKKLALLYVISGSISVLYADGIQACARQGQYMLYDGAVANTTIVHKARFIQLDLPRIKMRKFVSASARSNEFVQAMQHCALSHILSVQLNGSLDVLNSLNVREYPLLLDAMQSVAFSVISSASLNMLHNPACKQSGLYYMALTYIERNLSDPRLDAQTIANAVGCSRATLYSVFNNFGHGVASYIREERINKLANLLKHACITESVADLGFKCGLHDPSNLGRLFRAKYNMSPSEFRSQQLKLRH